jgi:hypothetical protein
MLMKSMKLGSVDDIYFDGKLPLFMISALLCARAQNFTVPPVPAKAAKYDSPDVALWDREAVKHRLQQYGPVSIVPDFIHNFLIGQGPEYQAYSDSPDQFFATSFSDELGGMIFMPNTPYTPEKKGRYDNPLEAKNEPDGITLVGFWIPPKTAYEDSPVFRSLFNLPMTQEQEESQIDKETISDYEARTGCKHITTTSHLRPEYLPLLKEAQELVNAKLTEIYGVSRDYADISELFFHFPMYCNVTAGLHMHVRVNQGVHPFEKDNMRFPLEEMIELLRVTPAEKIVDAVIDRCPMTGEEKILSLLPCNNPHEFENSGEVRKPNPWARSEWQKPSYASPFLEQERRKQFGQHQECHELDAHCTAEL